MTIKLLAFMRERYLLISNKKKEKKNRKSKKKKKKKNNKIVVLKEELSFWRFCEQCFWMLRLTAKTINQILYDTVVLIRIIERRKNGRK